jgi:hypothetical protein
MDPYPCASHESLAIVEKADILRNRLVDSRAEKVQWLVQTVVETHSELLKLPHFRPGNAINQLLGNLVSVCSEIHDRDIVDKVCRPPQLWQDQADTARSSPTPTYKHVSRPSARSAPKPSPASSCTGPSAS